MLQGELKFDFDGKRDRYGLLFLWSLKVEYFDISYAYGNVQIEKVSLTLSGLAKFCVNGPVFPTDQI